MGRKDAGGGLDEHSAGVGSMRELKETTIVEGTGALKKHRGCWKGGWARMPFTGTDAQ